MKSQTNPPSPRFSSAGIEAARQQCLALYGARRPLAHIHSYGCQQNVSDGEKIKGMLAEIGYDFTERREEADLVIYNTCAVREHAEQKLYGNVGALKGYKAKNPGMVIGLCGCMMQQKPVQERIRRSYPFVDLVFGTHALQNFPQNLCEVLRGRQGSPARVFDAEEGENVIVEGMPVRRDGSVKAWVPIMYGCDNFCSYCVVPLVRGREVSRRPEDVVAEVRGLVEAGYKEITLLGQNVNSYGKGLDEPCDFADLLERICRIPGDFWVRFMTSHPKDITHKLLDLIAREEKLCSHIHLPVQSGSDRVLREMNRHYDRAGYLEKIAYAKAVIPGVTFTSDIIVGFPGESEEEFLQTVDLVREVGYASLFIFIFSPRPGTRAAGMEDPVPAAEKSRWFAQLQEVQRAIGSARFAGLVGQTLRVLVDGPGKQPGQMTGRDEHGTVVAFAGEEGLGGQFVRVKITEAQNWAVAGELV